MKKVVLFFLMAFGALSLSADQTLAEQTKLTGAKAIAKFPARLQNSEIAHLVDASWCQLMPGVEYFYGKFDLLYNTTANDVSFFKIDYKNAPIRMKFVDNRRNGGSNKQTSYVANKYNALFGINCTFPAWYAKMEGTVVNNGNKEGGLALNDDKTFEFFKSNWWTDHPNAEGYTDAFSTEAMGLYHGSQSLSGTGWGQAPYTFMGATQDGGTLYVCVVDGRTTRSQGLGYGTVHSFLIELGCYDGMCIDGGGSTTMVCQKSLMPPFPEHKMNELQHESDNANAKPNYYTMNHTTDNPERAVCNQLLFIEDVATVTPDIGRHGSCTIGSTVLGTELVKFSKNVTQTLSVTADSGYVIAALSVDGVMVGDAKGRASYSDSILLSGDKSIAVSFVKKGAWWLYPTVKNDFLLEAKSGNNGTDLTTQHPDVCLDEKEQDVFFSTSVHGYSSGSYWTGLREFSVASLKGWNTGDAITPVMGTDKNVNGTGTYAYSIAASRAAGAVVALQKVNSGTKYPVVCPIGGQWGGGATFNSTRDDRYVMSVLSFPDDKNAYHTTSPGVFGTDGKHFFGGYNRNAHIVEFDVRTGTDGHLEFHHTGKVIKHKAQVTGLVCKKMVLGGVPKDVLFTSHHSTTMDTLDIVVPGEMAVQTNSSSLPTCLTIPYHLDNIAVTGIADGTPRIIGHVLDTANAQHGNYVVYDLKDDLSGLRFTDPIAIVNAQSAFGKATGCLASLDDDTTAFINYYNAKELHALTVQGDASVEPPTELVPVAKPTAASGLVYNGSAQTGVAAATGYTVSNGSGTAAGNYTATVTLAQGYCWTDESTSALSLPWSVGQKALTVTAENKSVTYGAAAPAFTVTYSGFVGGETAPALGGTLAFDCAYTATTAAGSTLDILPKGLTSSNYAITFAKGTLTVTKATYDLSGVTFADATVGYDGQPHSLAVAGLPSGVTASYANNAKTAAGTYAITASFTGDANHEAITATKKATLTISRRAVTVKAKDRTIGLGMTPSAFGYDVTAGSLVSGETLAGALACEADGKTAGTWSITQGTLTDANNPNYAITFVGGTLTVVQLTAVLNPATADYDGEVKAPSVTVLDGSGAALPAGSYTVTKPTGEVKDAGTYTYGVSVTAGELTGLELSADFVIRPKTVAVTVTAGQKKTYGAADPAEFACAKDALVGTDAYSGALVRAEGENVGAYAIAQGTLTAGKNYAIAFTGADFEITKKELTVTAKPVVLTYGDENPATFAFDIAGFALSDTQAVVTGDPTFTCDYAKGRDVGTYDIAVNVGGLSADNYTFAGVKGTLTVSPKVPVLSEVSATAITYCQTLADSVVSATVDPDVAGVFAWDYASLAPAVADGGETVYTGTFTPNDTKNYRAVAFETTVVINRKEIAVPTANTGLVFNFSEQTGVASGEGYTLSGEKATQPGDYVATAALTDKANTCWADDKTTDDKEIAWSIAESTPEVSGTAKAGVDWNGSEVTLDIENLNLGSHALEDLAAMLEVNGKSYEGTVTAQGAGAYRVSFAVDATGANAVVATNGYEGAYRVTLAGGTDDPVVVASGTQDVLQGVPSTATNEWFHETAATLGQTGAWTKGGESVEPVTENGRIVVEPTETSALDFTPAKEMDAGTKGVVEAGILFEGPGDEDDAVPADGVQCAARIAEDDETDAVKLQVYAALPDGDGGWSVGWHDWNQPEAETYSFAVGTEYVIRFVCDYETESNALKCFVKRAGAEDYVQLFSGYLTGVVEGTGASRRVASLGFKGMGKVSVLDGTFTRDFLDASVATVGGVKYATVADAVAAGGQVALLWDASWSPNAPGEYAFAKDGHDLVIGGTLAYQVKDNGDGTVTVTVAGDDPDAPVASSITLKGEKVAIGVANPEAKRRYCLARAAKPGDEFVPDETTWKTGAELLEGALLEVTVTPGATAEFFKVVVE